jgi:flagellar hook-associated protein 2
MTTQYTNLTKTISDWEDKVSDKEDYYYSKFSSMETALAKLNSQTSSISSLLG